LSGAIAGVQVRLELAQLARDHQIFGVIAPQGRPCLAPPLIQVIQYGDASFESFSEIVHVIPPLEVRGRGWPPGLKSALFLRLVAFDGRFEIANAFAEAFGHFGDLLTAEHNQRNGRDHQ
jgi:hypothetical protein